MARKKDIMAEALAFLSTMGVDTSEIPTETDKYDYKNEDAVVIFANQPSLFTPNICKNCKKPFATNKRSAIGSPVGFCSDICRREDWKRTTGLDWKAISTRDVWDGDPPLIITSQQLKNLESIVDWFNRNRKVLTLVPDQDTEQDNPQVDEILVGEIVEDEDLWEFHDSHTSPQPLLDGEVEEQNQEEEDPFDF